MECGLLYRAVEAVLKRALNIPFLILLPAGFFMFSKGAMINYSIAHLFSIGLETWIATFMALGVRVVSLLGSWYLKGFKVSFKEGVFISGILSVLTSIGYFSVFFIDDIIVVFVASLFFGLGVVGNVVNQGSFFKALNSISKDKKDFSTVFAGADVIKIGINLFFAIIMTFIISIYDSGVALLVVGFMHFLFGFWMVLKSGVFKNIVLHRKSAGLKKKLSSIDSVRDLSRVGFWVMLVGVWMGVVPAVEVLQKYSLDGSWVGILTLIMAAAYSLSFVFLMCERFIPVKYMVFISAFVVVLGGVSMLCSSGPELFFVGVFTICLGVGMFFTSSNLYLNYIPGNEGQKLAQYFYLTNFWQFAAYGAIPFIVKFEFQYEVLFAIIVGLAFFSLSFFIKRGGFS